MSNRDRVFYGSSQPLALSLAKGRLASMGRTGLRQARPARMWERTRFNAACMGFTLIEVLVALAIFSLAVLALLRLQGVSLTNSAALEDQAIAAIVARNVAVEALTNATPSPFGTTRGQEQSAGRVWRWTRIARRAPESRLQRIDIAVANQHGRIVGSLTVYRRLA